MLYPWLKAIHVIAVISWMAGLLYLPRLFVYHVDARPGSELSETFKIMERRLLRFIMNPAMIVAFACGLGMVALNPALLHEGFFQLKLACVAGLTAAHMVFARWRREFAEDRNRHPARTFRIANEVPTLLMIAIVIAIFVWHRA